MSDAINVFLLWRQFLKTCMRVSSLIAFCLYNENVTRWGKCGLVAQGILQITGTLPSPSDRECQWRHVLSAVSYVFIIQVVSEATVGSNRLLGKLCFSSKAPLIWGHPNILYTIKKNSFGNWIMTDHRLKEHCKLIYLKSAKMCLKPMNFGVTSA